MACSVVLTEWFNLNINFRSIMNARIFLRSYPIRLFKVLIQQRTRHENINLAYLNQSNVNKDISKHTILCVLSECNELLVKLFPAVHVVTDLVRNILKRFLIFGASNWVTFSESTGQAAILNVNRQTWFSGSNSVLIDAAVLAKFRVVILNDVE